MGRIYSCATQVVVWLGLTGDDSDIAMDKIQTYDQVDLATIPLALSSKHMKAILALCTRSYWHRIWVVQEMRLAKGLEFHCGAKSTSGRAFQGLYLHMPQIIDQCLSVESDQEVDIWLARTLRGSIALTGHIARRDYHGRFQDWLLHCSKAEFVSSEPRDMVYALLGMSWDIKEGDILPDYEKDITEVFADALQLCRTTRKMDSFGIGGAIALGDKLGIDGDEVLSLYARIVGDHQSMAWIKAGNPGAAPVAF
jgi:hypothetical protein